MVWEGWQYLLFNLNGDGTEDLVHPDVKLSGPSLSRVLSGPHEISGSLALPDASLLDHGQLLIRRWKTALMAVMPGGDRIWCGGIVADYHIDGPSLVLDVAGFTAYPKDQPYDGEYEGVGVDPTDIYRMLWSNLQAKAGGDLGLEIDSTTSDVRVGTPAENVDFTTSSGENVNFTAGPVKINWWSTDDVGGYIDTMAKATPFDTLEDHHWEDDQVRHFVKIGVPSIGNRKDDLRFVLGENVFKMPSETYAGEDVATEVWVFGSGEGRDRVRGVAGVVVENSVRRVIVIDDKTITSKELAYARASQELFFHQPDTPGAGIAELVIRNHPNAPLGSYDVGDEIRYSGDHDWGTVDIWVTILKLTARPEEGDDLIATVTRSDTIR